jgi:DNA primase large subunit
MENVLRKHLPLPRDGSPLERVRAIRRDVISHFVLRLAYRNPNDKDWFLRMERALLEVRLQLERRYDTSAVRKFVEENGLVFEKISATEWESTVAQIRRTVQSYRSQQEAIDSDRDHYYRIPFEQASELVQLRRVYLQRGFAYVHEDDLVSIIMAQYRQTLIRALEHAFRTLPQHKDERIDPLLTVIPKQYIGKDYSQTNNSKGKHKVTINDIDALARRSFPLCMRSLHSRLRANHHLKHQARMQYGLFLKGIGVSLEDSLEFWRREIVQKYGEDGWRKKGYAYNIKHNYGMEGKRASYTPHSCQKIINFDVLPSDDHGCPFRHRENSSLMQQFHEAGIRDNDVVNEIMHLVRERHYQEACKRYYDALHPEAIEYIQNHPNKYFEESMAYWDRKQGVTAEIKK